LKRLGAANVLAGEAVDHRSGRPLLSGTWAGGIDTVGGHIPGTMVRSRRHGGCVAACGLAACNELPLTVCPFMLCGGGEKIFARLLTAIDIYV
jgi:acrylyl-CoA reductase (NADPH)